MHAIGLVTPVFFILAWFGAAACWSVAAYSVTRLWADGPMTALAQHRTRAFQMGVMSAMCVSTALAAGFAGGLIHL